MRSRVLYFPYIQVPETTWLTQMLLYWDQVSSIVPYDYVHNPESLGPYMLTLVREQLVHQVIPGAHIGEIPQFHERFIGFLDGLGPALDRRREEFARRNVCRIHIEKMGTIGDALVKLRVAQPEQYPWYNVENQTADDFMSYLATTLGQLDSVDSSPLTDSDAHLTRLALAGVPQHHMAQQLDSLRIQVLNEVLPVPTCVVPAAKLRAFKEKRAAELGDFRRRVERELVAAANIADPALRQRHLDVFFDEAKERILEIQESMDSAGWETARSGLSVIVAIPGVSPTLGLVGAVLEAVTGRTQQRISPDFAYAAHAGIEVTGRAAA